MVPWTHRESAPNGISIGSAVFAQHTRVTSTQTDGHTDHATCIVCSNRPHLCTECTRCSLVVITKTTTTKTTAVNNNDHICTTLQAKLHLSSNSKKVKFSHTRYRAFGPELIPVYRQSAHRWLEAIHPAVGCHYFLPGLRLPSQPKSVAAHRPVPNYTAW